MSVTVESKHINLFAEKVKEFYGERLYKIILFGSHAKGTDTSKSDIDIAIVLNDNFNELDEITNVQNILMENELMPIHNPSFAVIDFTLLTKDEYFEKGRAFPTTLHEEGIEL